MTVKEHTYVVLSNALPGQEAEFNTWYSERHLADVVAIPGFVLARRFKLKDPTAEGAPTQRYMALYNIETEDPIALLASLREMVETGRMEMSPAASLEDMQLMLYEAITPWVMPKNKSDGGSV